MAQPPPASSRSAPESGSGAAGPSRVPFATRFGDLIANHEDETGARERRTRGFLLVVPGKASLQAAQALCYDPTFTQYTCLTARYLVSPGPIFGTVLGTFASDIQRMRTSDWDPALMEGDLLPEPRPTPQSSSWADLLSGGPWDSLFEQVQIRSLEQGTIGPAWLTDFLKALRPQEVVPAGTRVIIFAQLDGSVDGVGEWRNAILKLLPLLPKRMGLVVSGAPTRFQRPQQIAVDDPHFALVDADELPSSTPGKNTYHYLDSALSGDQPADRDLLGVDRFADALARLVLHPDTKPLTIGIQGAWGSGKSSFMQLTKQHLVRHAPSNVRNGHSQRLAELEQEFQRMQPEGLVAGGSIDMDDQAAANRLSAEEKRQRLLEKMAESASADVVPIEFNAWQYDSANQIWAGLASSIMSALEGSLPIHRRLGSRLRYSFRNRTSEVVLGFILPVIVVGLMIAAASRILSDPKVSELLLGDLAVLSTAIPGGLLLGVGVIVWRFASQFVPISERVMRYARGTDYGAQMGLQHQVIRDLDFVRWRLRPIRLRRPRLDRRTLFGRIAVRVPGLAPGPPPPRVVIFIDDLDRCSDDKVVDILQAINLILGKSSFFVFLGMDTDMIYRAIDKRYNVEARDRRQFAESYLRKIVQLSFHLPQADPEQRLALVRQMFSPSARRDLASAKSKVPAGQSVVAGGTPKVPTFRPEITRARGAGKSVADPFVFDRGIILPPSVVPPIPVTDTKEELEAFAEFTRFVSPNPREIKRLVNVHRLVRIMLVHQGRPLSEPEQRKLVAWLVFCSSWKDLVDDALRIARESTPNTNVITTLAAQVRDNAQPDLKAFSAQLGKAGTFRASELRPLQFFTDAANISQMVRDEPPGAAGSTAPASTDASAVPVPA